MCIYYERSIDMSSSDDIYLCVAFLAEVASKLCIALLGPSLRRSAVVSGVRRMNEVNPRRARLGPTGMGDRLRHATSQLGQLSLASLRGR